MKVDILENNFEIYSIKCHIYSLKHQWARKGRLAFGG